MTLGNVTRIVTTLGHKSGIEADAAQFRLHYRWDGEDDPTESDLEALGSHVDDFLNVAATGGFTAINTHLGPQNSVASGHLRFDYYQLPDEGPAASGPPVHSNTSVLQTTDDEALPSEVAACLSFRGGYSGRAEFSGDTRPRARRRNRIYLGPLGSNVLSLDSETNQPLVSVSFRESVTAAAAQYLSSEAASDDWLWTAFSQTEWADDLVVEAWMDNAFDVQRRRGEDSTARTSIDL